MERTVGVGYLDLTGCMALGVTGPILRAAGLPCDLRKSQPYCGYETYDFDVPTETTCDAYGRYLVRIARDAGVAEDRRAGLDRLRAGPGHGRGQEDRLAGAARARRRRPRQLPRPHPAHHGPVDGGADPPLQAGDRGLPGAGRARSTSPIESPRGELGVHVVSDGGTRPYRVHFRDPSFINLQAAPAMSEGGMVADVIAAVASIDPVMGGVDR